MEEPSMIGLQGKGIPTVLSRSLQICVLHKYTRALITNTITRMYIHACTAVHARYAAMYGLPSDLFTGMSVRPHTHTNSKSPATGI